MDVKTYTEDAIEKIDKAIQDHILDLLADGKDNLDELGVLEKTIQDLAEIRSSAHSALKAIVIEDGKIKAEGAGTNEDLLKTATLVAKRVVDRVRILIAPPKAKGNGKTSFGLAKDKVQVTKKEVGKMESVYTKSITQVRKLYPAPLKEGSEEDKDTDEEEG